MFLLRGLCLGSHVPSRASLFKGVSVQGSLCPGGVSPGLSPSGDLCPGVVLCPEEGLCPRGSLLCYFQGVSVQQGLCSGGSLSRGSMSRGGLCPRESLSVGSLSAERDPRTGKIGWYASYRYAFLFSSSLSVLLRSLLQILAPLSIFNHDILFGFKMILK